jgi:hypothetical protein
MNPAPAVDGDIAQLLHRRRRGLGWSGRAAFVASPVSFRPAATTWADLHRQARSDQRQLAAALGKLGGGGGRAYFGLYCYRGLRPVLETAAYMLARSSTSNRRAEVRGFS